MAEFWQVEGYATDRTNRPTREHYIGLLQGLNSYFPISYKLQLASKQAITNNQATTVMVREAYVRLIKHIQAYSGVQGSYFQFTFTTAGIHSYMLIWLIDEWYLPCVH